MPHVSWITSFAVGISLALLVGCDRKPSAQASERPSVPSAVGDSSRAEASASLSAGPSSTPGIVLFEKTATGYPSARYAHAMTYDSKRSVVVMMGGYDAQDKRNVSTLEWDGAKWTHVSKDGPIPREQHAMAFDAARGVTVLFGGYGTGKPHDPPVSEYESPVKSETWTWDGKAWSLRTSKGPQARYWHAMAYDAPRESVLMFGGRVHIDDALDDRTGIRRPVQLGDTWTWDGERWTKRNVSGPKARWGHAMAYDSKRGVVVLFGGIAEKSLSNPDPSNSIDDEVFGDTWEWDGENWTRRASPSPKWRYENNEWVQYDGNYIGPPPRAFHTMAYHEERGTVVLYGGYNGRGGSDTYGLRGWGGVVFSDAWEWDGERWKPLMTTGIGPVRHHQIVYDAGRKALVAFGGLTRDNAVLGDTFTGTAPASKPERGSK